MVSSDFGKLEVQRHFSSGIDCAMAGIASAVAAVAAPVSPAAFRNSRRFMVPSEKAFAQRAMRPRTVTFRYHDLCSGGIPLRVPTGALFSPSALPDAKAFGHHARLSSPTPFGDTTFLALWPGWSESEIRDRPPTWQRRPGFRFAPSGLRWYACRGAHARGRVRIMKVS